MLFLLWKVPFDCARGCKAPATVAHPVAIICSTYHHFPSWYTGLPSPVSNSVHHLRTSSTRLPPLPPGGTIILTERPTGSGGGGGAEVPYELGGAQQSVMSRPIPPSLPPLRGPVLSYPARSAWPVGRRRGCCGLWRLPGGSVLYRNPGYMSRKFRKFRTNKFDTLSKRKFLLMQLM